MYCCVGSSTEVELCADAGCFLFPYRFGYNPARAGMGIKGNLEKKNGCGPLF
jgi:hypothetical protein